MNSQDIFKAIITDDNITLLEAVYSTLYEKSNLLVEEYKINVAENILTERGDQDLKDSMRKSHAKDNATTTAFKHSANLEIAKDEAEQENSAYNRNIKFQNRDKRHTGMSANDIKNAKRDADIERAQKMWSNMQNRKNTRGNIHQSIY